ncbi:SRPBCC family protein [Streptomyces albidoflavus]|uniref:SRPBCC family protein n=1 Tax=Streptomyces koyangensis TaxID=188770 RepID=UPI0033929C4B
MSSLAVTASSHSSASAAIVYAALLDAESWPLWSAYADVEWDVPAGVDRPAREDDLRTIRSRIGRVCCRERVVEMVPGRRFSYEQAAGLFTSHRGSVDLTRAPPWRHRHHLVSDLPAHPLSWTCSGAGVYRFGSTISRHTPTRP